jgi:hypothetical protein
MKYKVVALIIFSTEYQENDAQYFTGRLSVVYRNGSKKEFFLDEERGLSYSLATQKAIDILIKENILELNSNSINLKNYCNQNKIALIIQNIDVTSGDYAIQE